MCTDLVGSATVEAVRSMALVASRFGGKVKAAGGVRSFADAVAMIEAGAYLFLIHLVYSIDLSDLNDLVDLNDLNDLIL